MKIVDYSNVNNYPLWIVREDKSHDHLIPLHVYRDLLYVLQLTSFSSHVHNIQYFTVLISEPKSKSNIDGI
jgi:hypothetical protein